MPEQQSDLHIGQLVEVTRGREAGKVAVVIECIDARFVYIADGDKRRFDRPKKKNRLHLRPLDYISEEVVASLQESGRVTNAKLRFAVNKYLQQAPSETKGE